MQASVSPSDTVSTPISMDIVHLPLAKLRPRADARPIDKKAIASLTASVREIGSINPLRVRPAQITAGEQLVDGWEIITGHHRSIVARDLAIDLVPCVIVSDDDLRAEIAMIDENLCRAELTPMQVSVQTSRRKEIYEALHPETKRGGNASGPSGQFVHTDAPSFTAQTAKATGRDERTIRRDAARGEALKADAARITGTSLDKGVELDALAKMSPEERKPIIDRAAAGEKVTARKVNADSVPAEESIEAKAGLVDHIRAALRKAVADNNFSVDYSDEDRETTPLDVVACLLGFDGAYVPDDALSDLQAALFAILDMPADPWPGLTRADLNLMIKGRHTAAQRMGIRRFPDSYEVGLREKTLLAARRDWIESGAAITPEAPTTEKLSQPATVSERSPHGADEAAEFAGAAQAELVPSTPAPLSVVPTAVVSVNLTETSRPASKITHLIAAKHAPKSYPGAGEGWKQRHSRRH